MCGFLSRYTLPRNPGERFEYSNLGIGLLGHVLALRAGTSYEALVVDRILGPLDMRATRVTLTPNMRAQARAGLRRERLPDEELGSPDARWCRCAPLHRERHASVCGGSARRARDTASGRFRIGRGGAAAA